MPESELLDQMEKALRAMAPMQYWNAADPHDKRNGAIIDPIDKREIQYGTPLFAFNVATLVTKAAQPICSAGIPLDKATLNIATGRANDSHGEFSRADGEGNPPVRGAQVKVSADHGRKTQNLEGPHEDPAQRLHGVPRAAELADVRHEGRVAAAAGRLHQRRRTVDRGRLA